MSTVPNQTNDQPDSSKSSENPKKQKLALKANTSTKTGTKGVSKAVNQPPKNVLPAQSAELAIMKELYTLLDEKKAENILLLDLRECSNYLSFFCIATGLSLLHIKNLTSETVDFMKSKGIRILNNPSADIESGWQVLDFGPLIVHFFTAEKRDFYKLEKVWEKAAPV